MSHTSYVRRGQRWYPILSGALAALLAAACTQSSGDPTQAADLSTPFPTGTIDLQAGPVMVPAGMERTVCVNMQFPLSVPIDVVQIATHQLSSHHVIFYKYVSGGVPTLNQTPQDCAPLDLLSGGTLREPLFIGESTDPTQNVLQLPAGVAYHFEPTDYYRIEMHVVNATPNDLSATVDVFLSPAMPNTQIQYADMLFFNDTSGLNKNYDGVSSGLPPLTQTTIDPAFYTVQPGLKVFGINTHQHHLGTGIAVSKSTSASAPGTPLFTNTDWQHPPLYTPPSGQPLTFNPGEGLRWVCSYNNTTMNYVKFGESALTNEMCIIWGYYYPSAGFELYSN